MGTCVRLVKLRCLFDVNAPSTRQVFISYTSRSCMGHLPSSCALFAFSLSIQIPVRWCRKIYHSCRDKITPTISLGPPSHTQYQFVNDGTATRHILDALTCALGGDFFLVLEKTVSP